jgi:hypothetical protein
MTPALAQREAALAGVALLAAVAALALASPRGESEAVRSLPKPVLVNGGWYDALAGVGDAGFGRRTSCGWVLKAATIGVADPVLPCGVKLYVARGDSPTVLAQVIDRRPVVPGRRFDLTPALAAKLGVQGVQPIRWVYAR